MQARHDEQVARQAGRGAHGVAQLVLWYVPVGEQEDVRAGRTDNLVQLGEQFWVLSTQPMTSIP
jgi:hypothetical protein